jgi:LPXTG-site transpeptidase (sortase) family protein
LRVPEESRRVGSRRPRLRRWEQLLFAAGLGCVGWGAAKVAAPVAYAHAPQPVQARLLREGTLQTTGRLTVPRLGLSALILDGPEETALAVGAAHVQGTPLPGDPGNSVIAGHRDSVFRELRHIRRGDLVEIQSGRAFRYRVDSVDVVAPDDLSVLSGGPSPTLTLLTCFPFYFVGDAPRRFVVRASLVE